jgi:hypothetical protein
MRSFFAALVLLAMTAGMSVADVGSVGPGRAEVALAAARPFAAEAAPTTLRGRFAMVEERLAFAETPEPAATPSREGRGPIKLGADRARILLRSLTLPGWGQATLGRRTSAKVFLLTEAGIWGSFVSFRVQEAMRRRSYEVTAKLHAGIDLEDRDEEFRRIVGVYPSSEYYNLYVVRRDAANLYYDDPVEYENYIAAHELKGNDTWAWAGPESYDLYGEQRKLTRKAALRANAMLGLAIANRLLSAVHAARNAGAPPAQRSWNLEIGPRASDPTSMALGMQVRF